MCKSEIYNKDPALLAPLGLFLNQYFNTFFPEDWLLLIAMVIYSFIQPTSVLITIFFIFHWCGIAPIFSGSESPILALPAPALHRILLYYAHTLYLSRHFILVYILCANSGVPFSLIFFFFASKRNEAKQKPFRFLFASFCETKKIIFRFVSLLFINICSTL